MKPLLKIDLEKHIYCDNSGWIINPLEEKPLPANTVGNLHIGKPKNVKICLNEFVISLFLRIFLTYI